MAYTIWKFWEKNLIRKLLDSNKVDNFIYAVSHLFPSYPEHVLIQTNYKCTRRCVFCFYGNPNYDIPDVVMPDCLFKKIIDDLSEINYAGRISLFEINEPLTEHRIVSMTKYVREKLPECWQLIVTNGDLISHQLVISLFEAGLNYLIINSYSINRYLKMIALRQTLPENILIKIINQNLSDNHFANDNRGGNIDCIKTEKPLPLHEPCERINNILYIKPEGFVVSCFGDFFNINMMGNVKDHSAIDIWFGKKFKAIRKRLNMSDRKITDICKKCNSGGLNSFFNREYIENMVVNQSVIKSAIIGANGNAKKFSHYLKKYSHVKYIYSKSGHGKKYFPNENDQIIDNINTILADPEIDFLYISNQSKDHYKFARMALLAGKHVLVEKPIAFFLEDIDELIELSKNRNLLLGGIFQWRFLECVKIVKKMIESGEFGSPLFINTRIIWNRSHEYYVNGRGTWNIDGGGVLIKQAIHFLDLIIYIFGFPKSWQGYCETVNKYSETEDTVAILLKFKNSLGTLISTVSFKESIHSEIEIIGTKGRVIFNSNDDFIYADKGIIIPFYEKNDIYDKQILNFIESIFDPSRLVVTAQEAKKSLIIIRDIYDGIFK